MILRRLGSDGEQLVGEVDVGDGEREELAAAQRAVVREVREELIAERLRPHEHVEKRRPLGVARDPGRALPARHEAARSGRPELPTGRVLPPADRIDGALPALDEEVVEQADDGQAELQRAVRQPDVAGAVAAPRSRAVRQVVHVRGDVAPCRGGDVDREPGANTEEVVDPAGVGVDRLRGAQELPLQLDPRAGRGTRRGPRIEGPPDLAHVTPPSRGDASTSELAHRTAGEVRAGLQITYTLLLPDEY